MSIDGDGDNDGLVRIDGTFTVNRGLVRETVHFSIDAQHGYQQWGNTVEVLGMTGPVAQTITDALREAEVWADPYLDS